MIQKRLSEATKKRVKAGRMLLAGKVCADVALAVGVARQTGYTWKRLLELFSAIVGNIRVVPLHQQLDGRLQGSTGSSQ